MRWTVDTTVIWRRPNQEGAGRQLQNIRGALGEMYDAAGIVAVREDLDRRAHSYADVCLNSCESTSFDAAAASYWYCDGGFLAKE